ncbi:hypothetical protein ACFYOR_37750 [Streptomyces griseofuscus]|uniref:hypothetical protein n=1 Tax=Streptomyces griseofuscus TaxID=146922 RepID=UPI0036945BE4
MKKIAAVVATLVTVGSLSVGSVASAAPLPAQPHPWDKRIKCQAKDPQGRKIVTRHGNADFGWQHFNRRHNIKKCGTIGAIVNEHPESDDHHGRLTYGGVEFETGVPRPRMVKIVVIVQYSRKTRTRSTTLAAGRRSV